MTSALVAPALVRSHPANPVGVQRLYRFENGFGASVVRLPGSWGGDEGLYELAVLRFEQNAGIDDFELAHDTPITDGTVGWLAEDAVQVLLARIQALPAERKDAS